MGKLDIVVKPQMLIREALQCLDKTAKKVLFVTDKQEMLVGAISDGDIRRWILKGGSLDESITLVMNLSPIYLKQEMNEKAFLLMAKNMITAVPLVDNNMHIVNIIFRDNDQEKFSRSINAKVIIMAGGKGERLLPYTSIVPKPLIPIGEKPISELVMDSFKEYGCEEFYFTLNYKKNMIKAYYDELKEQYSVFYIEEDEPLGTGGSLYYLKDRIDETFFVSNCDIILDVDYADVYKFHKENNNLLTIITSIKKYTVPYGIVNIDQHGQISSLQEKPSKDYLVNTGVYVIEPEIFNYLKNKKFVHITELIEKCLKNGDRVGTYPISEDAWMDMGQFEDMEKMKKKFMV